MDKVKSIGFMVLTFVFCLAFAAIGQELWAEQFGPTEGIRQSVIYEASTNQTGRAYSSITRPESNLGEPRCNSQGPSLCNNKDPHGSPKWAVNMVNMNLYVTDTPLWYDSPIGPSVEIRLSYNSQADSVKYNPFGSFWQFNYGSYLSVGSTGTATIIMPDGRKDVYLQDGSGGYTMPYQVFNKLSKIAENNFELTFPDGTVYVYKIPSGTALQDSFLVEIRDAYGQKLTIGYDASAHLTTITDAINRLTILTYNASGLVTQVTDPFGRNATFQYDADKNLVNITDMGGYWTKLSYDINVYLTGIETGLGKWTFYIEPSDNTQTYSDIIDYPYPESGGIMGPYHRMTITNPSGGKEEYNSYSCFNKYISPGEYIPYSSANNNSNAKSISYTCNSIGDISEISQIIYPASEYLNFQYSGEGNIRAVTHSSGYYVQKTYNSMGRVKTFKNPKDTTTTMTYAANDVDLVKITNSLGDITLTYNNSHDVTSITDRLGNTANFSYNSYGQIASETNALGIVTNYNYDATHMLEKITKDGKTIHSFTHDSIGRIRTHTDATGLSLTYDYNNLDDITKITYPDGKYASIVYSANFPHLRESITYRSGQTVSYTYNNLRQLTKVINSEGGITTFDYDANGNMIKLTDTNGSVTTYDYDANNRLVKKTFADGKYETLEYNKGLPYRLTKSDGSNIYYSYGNNFNLTKINYSGTPDKNYSYDDYYRLTSAKVSGVDVAYTYNANSMVSAANTTYTGNISTKAERSFQYDAMGRMTGHALNGGQTMSYSYDSLDRLTGIQIDGANTYTYSYSGAGPLIRKLSRPNGSFTEYDYDALTRLTKLTNKTSSNTLINQYEYAYNSQDLRSSEKITNSTSIDSLNNESTAYSYNNLNQLLTTTSPEMTLAYDTKGNMTQGYTPEGSTYSASYDANNRLNLIKNYDKTEITYIYGADDFIYYRYDKDQKGKTTPIAYVRNGGLLLGELDANKKFTRQYAWGANLGGGIGGLLNLKQDGQDYSYLYDGKGNVTALLDSSQNVVAEYTYDPFGNRISKTGTLDQPIQFSTKPYDEKTGLSYYGYRFYSPTLGRWLTRDPLGEAGGMNLYGFVRNNPVNYIDPDGLEPTAARIKAMEKLQDVRAKTIIELRKEVVALDPTTISIPGIWSINIFTDIYDSISDICEWISPFDKAADKMAAARKKYEEELNYIKLEAELKKIGIQLERP